MADTLIEQTRALHEDTERLERLIVKDFKQDAKSHKEKLMQGHRVRKRLDQIQESSRKLLRIYEDDDKQRREEIDALGGEEKVFSRFYDRLKEVRDYHRRFVSLEVTEAENDEAALKEEPAVEFTGEEGGGRYLDLHQLHQAYINAKFGKKVEYMDYLSSFSDFSGIPKHLRVSKPYRDYLQQLLAYLESFYSRTQPLTQLQRQKQKVDDDTRQAWEAGSLAGWEDKGSAQVAGSSGTTIDLEAFESPEELATIGADRLKEALAALGLKSGGTPAERASRLFQVKHKPLAELDKSLFAKGVLAPSAAAAHSAEEKQKREAAALQIAVLEAQVMKLAQGLVNTIQDTRGRVEKKQSQTYEELQAEQEEGDADLPDPDSDDQDEFVYNPLKLPLGWDGKPIPYWLYKLHGLNHEFKCEICGNYSYWGRRAYEKHFKEWRHQNGMRALGIPNNKNFFEVTDIAEATALWATMQEKNKGGFHADVDEEFEDAQGNVYSRKTYEDMKRQGLL